MSDTRSRYGDGDGEDGGAAVVGSGDGGAVVGSAGGAGSVGAGSAGVVSVGVVSVGVVSVGAGSAGVVSVGVVSVGALSVGAVPLGLVDDGAGEELVGDGSLLPTAGVPVAVGVGGPGGTCGASPRIATISVLNASSWAEICATEYDVMVLPNCDQPAPDVAEREQLLLPRRRPPRRARAGWRSRR